MGGFMSAGIARSQEALTVDERMAQRRAARQGQASRETSNSQKEPVPFDLGALDDAVDVVIADHNAAEARKNARARKHHDKITGKRPRAAKPDVGELDDELPEETPQQQIDRLAQSMHVQHAAIDSAVALTWARRGVKPLSRTEAEAKRRITPTEELWDELFMRMAEGESVFTICHDDHMPHRTTLQKQIQTDTSLFNRHQAALHQRADKLMEQVVEESRILKERAAHGASTEEVKAHQVFINSLQWTAAKLNPAKYGDKQTVDLNANVTMSEQQVNMKLAVLLRKMTAEKPKDEDADGNS